MGGKLVTLHFFPIVLILYFFGWSWVGVETMEGGIPVFLAYAVDSLD
jgi:hypothetical protein